MGEEKDSGRAVKTLPDGPISKTQRYRRKRIAVELGVPDDRIPDRRGYHNNHPSAGNHPRWNAETKMIAEHGYVKVRVGRDHPLADPNGYTYEHLLVWVSAGRARPVGDEIIHHDNEDKTDNRLSNLKLSDRYSHGVLHFSKLSDAQIVEIRVAYAEGSADMPALSLRYDVPVSRVGKIIRGETRARAGGPTSTNNRSKKAAGRTLDGVTHDEFPAPAKAVDHA